ncbi:tRNA pseudouridine(38-40) synthase TruA [Coprobacter tertius]|uniref:tRNA pseudouridine synthase A n=1 Tax=Coprobacter tertius TaxID=2944915 RepID=A0ABT1MKD2_9BACT|nr:tRNA pseudouridine(38-40) synthase TruA [Coprobacter tertius]
MSHRYFLYSAYDGSGYHGWQVQPNGITVQQRIEESLSTLLRRETPITGAGRTDTGVHAKLMAAHFDTEEPVNDANALCNKLNRILPPDISIYRIVPVREDAHARFDAISRTYRYYITDRKNPFDNRYAWRIHGKLDFEEMNKAALKLFDYTDFTSFSKLHTDVKTNNCRIMQAKWEKEGELYAFTIQADRFLRNMVRAIVGTVIDVGRRKLSVQEFCRIIEQKDRCKAGTSAPANALFLCDISYPDTIFI